MYFRYTICIIINSWHPFLKRNEIVKEVFIIKIGSKELIRDINNHLVLETIIEKAPISRADLSKDLGLTKATISSIVQELITKSLVIEIGSGETNIGRKPTMLKLNQEAGYSMCIDLCVDHLEFMITDLLGNPIARDSVSYEAVSNHIILDKIFQYFDHFLSNCKKTPYGIIGATLAVHGVVDQNRIVFTPYYDLSSYDFVKELSERYHIPVFLYNEANLAVLGENTFSTHVENIACIGVHSGIGLGMVLNNKLYSGCNGYAGEFGHTIIELDGRPCPCGNKGCLEQYGSQRALLKDLAQMKNLNKVTFQQFEEWYEKRDSDAIKIAQQFVKIIAAGINNLLNLYNPEIIILNSQFTLRFPFLLEEIIHQLHSKTHFSKTIYLSKLNDEAVLYGATYINIVHFLQINTFTPQGCPSP